MLKTPVFWVLFVLFTIGTTSGLMVIGYASPIAQDVLAVSAEAAGAVVSYLAVGMVIGKIGWGVLSDRIGRYPVFVIMLIMAALALVVMWRSDTYLPVVLGICAVGLCYGGFLALMSPDHRRDFRQQASRHQLRHDVPDSRHSRFPIGPRLAAAVIGANGGDYGWAFIIAAIISAAGLVLVCGYMVLARRRAPAKPKARTGIGGHVEEPKTSEA